MRARPRPRVIVDCDPGIDDAAALAVAAHTTDLVGITTVGGNAPLADVTRNALMSCQVFGIDVEVHSGADHPLVSSPRHAPEIHGQDGFAGPTLPELTRRAASDSAVEYLIETIRGEEGLWLIPMGPLTNIALALRAAPTLASKLAGISFMGGSAHIGNHSAVTEFNVLVDPEAAAVVVNSGTRIHMAGLDLTRQFVVNDGLADDLDQLGTAGAVMVSALIRDYLDRIELVRGERTGGLHDPVAVLAVSRPELVTSTLRRVDVELAGNHTRGMTVVDQRPIVRPDANVYHGHQLDHLGARAVLLEALAEADG